MTAISPASAELRELLALHRKELDVVMQNYGASNLRLFGSVARGNADYSSDIDVLVDLENPNERVLMRVGGLNEDFRAVLGHPVDVVTSSLLRSGIDASAQHDAVTV